MATLVYSSKNYSRHHIQVSELNENVNKLMNSIFTYSREKSERVFVSNNRYYYAPSPEYKAFVVRFKGIKK
tara:strand:+ start:15401 stop:15613 length:213 start_codon:yes stop_codon:yes gene_type:complete